jgi:CheY-like chemotaxis protein
MVRNKILIVDDEPDVVVYFETLFQDNGYDTTIAYNGVQGFESAKSEKPDLITLDITMPLRSGVRTYAQLKNETDLKNIPVIIITAVDGALDDFLEKIKELPVPDGFMSKPIDTGRLLKMIAALMSGK